ncbi:hypothetical protein Rhopal_000299-T1 [Rhodotorula paludigena]|uniref:Uncharacterized protein n=1 Tax=Rhodotorula paludigena TaxID=86838 RepID=A0AAV5G4U3_9BASI|nr:hypothetical protein Rhopal_000299-T1 [Rhodotorula paludigena]
MARRKQKWMDDGSDSDSSSPLDDPDDAFDPDDPDVAAERELFRNPYAAHRGKKRTREQLHLPHLLSQGHSFAVHAAACRLGILGHQKLHDHDLLGLCFLATRCLTSDFRSTK